MPQYSQTYRVMYQWLILQGLVVAAALWLWSQGLFGALLAADKSTLSGVIMLIFVAASLQAGWRARTLSRELCHTQALHDASRRASPLIQASTSGDVLIDGRNTSTSLAHEHLGFLAIKARDGEPAPAQDMLLERLTQRIRRGHESGWFIADLMLKLGLLGTVIGFILMLASIDDMSQIDIEAVQQVLTSMSGGMRVALYTTLTGLTAGILLGIQHQLLDQAADELMAQVVEISEVHLPRHLASLARSAD